MRATFLFLAVIAKEWYNHSYDCKHQMKHVKEIVRLNREETSMATSTTQGEVMRVVLSPSLKSQFQDRCAEQGQKMSERMRQLIVSDLSQEKTPADKLEGILASANRKKKASGLPEPTIEEIDAFIDSVRSERIRAGLVS